MAVEIGSDWLKVLQADRTREGLSVSRLHLQRIDTPETDVAHTLAAVCKRLGIAGAPVIGCLPRQSATLHMLTLPSTEPAEIADMVDLQIGKRTPYSRDEIVFDYRAVGTGREGYTRLMLAVVQRAILRHRFAVLEEAGLDVQRMTVSSEGLVNWFAAAGGTQGAGNTGCVLLDIDAGYSDLLVMGSGGPVFTRSILIGAAQLRHDPERWTGKLGDEVVRSLETWRAESPGETVERLLVTGAGHRMAGLAGTLGARVGVAAETRDGLGPVVRVPSSFAPEGEHADVSLTPLVGIGLAPRELSFNLVPETLRRRRKLVEKARGLTVLAIFLMSILVLLSVCTTLRYYAGAARLEEMRNLRRQTEDGAQNVQRMVEIIREAAKRRHPGTAAIAVVADLHALVPETVFFRSVGLDMHRRELRLSGAGMTLRDIRALVNNLEQSTRFRDVREGGATQRTPDGRYAFEIVCGVE